MEFFQSSVVAGFNGAPGSVICFRGGEIYVVVGFVCTSGGTSLGGAAVSIVVFEVVICIVFS